MSWRGVFIACVTLWLTFSIARQAFDLIGRLWIPVGVNLLQILCCIMGLFATCQRRPTLLAFFTCSCILSIAYNAVIFCWYLGYLGDVSRPILSAGLPYSFSFFLRHTPWCGAHFDLQKSKWVQDPCSTPYYDIEAAQAVLHALFATIGFIASIVLFCKKDNKNKKGRHPLSMSVDHLSNLSKFDAKRAHGYRNSSANGAGYMNSVYEEATEVEVNSRPNYSSGSQYEARSNYDAAKQNVERNSKRKRGKSRPRPMPHPDADSINGSGSSTYGDLNQPSTSREITDARNTQKGQSGRFRKGKERRALHLDENSGVERDGPTGNLQKLISFDPKSNDTLIRVRERIDSDSDEDRSNAATKYSKINKNRERGVDPFKYHDENLPVASYGTYEKIVPHRNGNANDQHKDSPADQAHKSPDVSGSDSGIPSSSCDTWPHTDGGKQKFEEVERTEIQLNSKQADVLSSNPIQTESTASNGVLRDSSNELPQNENARMGQSAFQIRSNEVSTVIGHYHSPMVMNLVPESAEIVEGSPDSAGISLVGSPIERTPTTQEYPFPTTSYMPPSDYNRVSNDVDMLPSNLLDKESYLPRYNTRRISDRPPPSTSEDYGLTLSREPQSSSYNPPTPHYSVGSHYGGSGRFTSSDVGIPLNSDKESFIQRLQETRKSANQFNNIMVPSQGLRSQLKFRDSSPGIPLGPDSGEVTSRKRPVINDNSLLV